MSHTPEILGGIGILCILISAGLFSLIIGDLL